MVWSRILFYYKPYNVEAKKAILILKKIFPTNVMKTGCPKKKETPHMEPLKNGYLCAACMNDGWGNFGYAWYSI